MFQEKVSGVIWVGPIYDRGGYGSVSRNYILGLHKIGIPVRIVNFGNMHDDLDEATVRILKQLTKTDVGNYPIGVINYTPDLYPKVRFSNVVKTVGCTIFETDRIPKRWVSLLDEVDEVWVPSRFHFNTFSSSGVDPKKIRVVPYAVDTDYYKPISETAVIPEKRGFAFLYVFAFGWRKGFDVLLESYLKEFTDADDVTLILKVYAWGDEKENIKKMILDSVKDHVNLDDKKIPHFVIIDSALSQDELVKLYNTCDLYISTDRANGWGMPCMEAMAMGKPAATIDWSGSTEFMNETNSLLIKPEPMMMPVDQRLVQDLPDLYSGHQWPAVSISEIRRVLRFAYEQREKLKDIARKGMKDIRQNYSLTRVAEYIQEILSREVLNSRPWYLRLRKPRLTIDGTLERNWRMLRRRLRERIKKIFKRG